MHIARTLLAGASLLAMTAHAFADPVSIGFALFAGPLGSVFSFSALVGFASLLPTIVGVGLAVGSALLRGGGPQQRVDPGQYRSTFETSDASEINVIGRGMVSGLKIFGNTKTTNRWRLIGHSATRLTAIEEYRVGGRVVVVESDGTVSSPPYAVPGGSHIHLLTKEGDGSETAWSQLVSAFPSLWTSDHRVRGIAQTLARYISPGLDTEEGIAKFNKLFQGGEPDVAIVGRFDLVYDPREPGHDPDDPETWEWSDNGPLCAARIMLRYPELTVDDFDWDFIADEADKADVLVATLTGTERRSRCSGIWLSESLRGDTMAQVLESIGCEITMSEDDKVRIGLIDDSPTSEGTLPLEYVVDWDWKSGPEAVERPNVCRVRYYSAERNYELADIDLTGIAWARIQSEIDRYGEKVFDVELPFCPSASQAQRIARRLFLLARAETGQSIQQWDGLWAMGRNYVNIEFPDLDESPLCKLSAPRIDDANGQVEIPYAVWPSELIDEPWNPATMEAAAPEVVPEIVYESEIDAPTAGSPILVQYPDTSYEIRLPFTPPGEATIAQAIYRTYTGGLPDAWQSMSESVAAGLAWAADGSPGTEADFRVQVFDAEDNPSNWSDTVNATLAVSNATPAAPVVGDDTFLSGDTATFSDVTIASLSAVQLKLWVATKPSFVDPYGSFSEVDSTDARPGTAYELVDENAPTLMLGENAGVKYRIIAYASDGTAGTPYEIEYLYEEEDP